MEFTTHYAIAKHGPFGDGEALSAYSIINVAMDTIDDILWTHKGLIDDLESRMDSAEGRLDTAESELVRIENKIDQAISEINEELQRVENKFDTAVTEINNEISRVENKFDSAVTEINENVDQIEQNITNLTQTVESNDDALWAAINAILDKIVGSNSANSDTGTITWGIDGNIAIGNMSLFGNEGLTSFIRARTGTGSNDVRVA